MSEEFSGGAAWERILLNGVLQTANREIGVPGFQPRRSRDVRSLCDNLVEFERNPNVATAFRFLQIFSLGTWVGSIVFFIVFTQGIFPVVNNNDLTGALVGYALGRLHVMGIVAGVVYLLATAAAEKSVGALARPAALLVFAMIVCTMLSQYGVIARMDALKLQMGSVSATPADNPLRVAFDRLHQYSVRIESAVLLSGLAALVFTARQK